MKPKTPFPSKQSDSSASSKRLLLFLVAITAASIQPAFAGWTEDAIRGECDYIVDCSFTEFAENNHEVDPTDRAYGAINVVRIGTSGHADWVNTGESAMASIGLMKGARHLHNEGEDISVYLDVLNRFFWKWVLEDGVPFEKDSNNINYGGAYQRVYYNQDGSFHSADGTACSDTAQVVVASMKYYEFLKDVNADSHASAWLYWAWPMMKDAGDFIENSYHSSQMLCGTRPSSVNSGDLWISDATMAHAALNCLDRFSTIGGHTPSYDYTAYANNLETGIDSMKDLGSWDNFYRYRDASDGYAGRYGDKIDQLSFLPYESDVISLDSYTGGVCDWWLDYMTYAVDSPSDWRHYGTNWFWVFSGDPANEYLYPGPGLQLAKVEWKYYKETGDLTYYDRAAKRLEFANKSSKSNLWFGRDGRSEANVPNGIVDWRSSGDYSATAGDWARFSDTSAYFIQVVLMILEDEDTTYQPVL